MKRDENTAKSLLVILQVHPQDHLKVESILKKTHFYFKNVATAGGYATLGGR
jgi:hypothetical protein